MSVKLRQKKLSGNKISLYLDTGLVEMQELEELEE